MTTPSQDFVKVAGAQNQSEAEFIQNLLLQRDPATSGEAS
jgi:hypothetical protein